MNVSLLLSSDLAGFPSVAFPQELHWVSQNSTVIRLCRLWMLSNFFPSIAPRRSLNRGYDSRICYLQMQCVHGTKSKQGKQIISLYDKVHIAVLNKGAMFRSVNMFS